MSSAEAAEFAKLADTTYRDVNIALANEFARYADRIGVDVIEVIAAANSQPYSHIHQPGLGVGGHCIPVYPHFLLDRAPELELVALARRGQRRPGRTWPSTRSPQQLGDLDGVAVLVLGLTYRDGVKELAYSRALPLIARLARSRRPRPRLRPAADRRRDRADGRDAWTWGEPAPDVARDRHADRRPGLARRSMPAWFPALELVVDGRNSLRDLALPDGVVYRGIGARR